MFEIFKFDGKNKDILNILKEKMPMAIDLKIPPRFENNQHFIKEFIRAKKIELCPKTRECLMDGKEIAKPYTELLKFLDIQPDKRNIRDKHLKALWDDYFDTEKQKKMREKAAFLLQHDPKGLEEIIRVSLMLYPDRNDYHSTLRQEFIISLKYWIQSILYKLNGKTFVWPIIPVFYSTKHGSGKSTFVRKLCSAFEPYIIDASLEKMCDTRYYKMFSDNFILNLEECKGATGTQIETLKSVITSPRIYPRILGSHDMPSIPNNVTCIGNGNVPISRVLNDVTGNRRFHDLPFLVELSQEQINSINSVKIIQSQKIWDKQEIEEMRGYYEKYIQPKQENTNKVDHVIEFVEMSQLEWTKPEDDKKIHEVNVFIPSKEIFGNFCDYWSKQGFKKPPRRFKELMLDICEIIGQNERRTATVHRGLYLNENYRRNVLQDLRYDPVNEKWSSLAM